MKVAKMMTKLQKVWICMSMVLLYLMGTGNTEDSAPYDPWWTCFSGGQTNHISESATNIRLQCLPPKRIRAIHSALYMVMPTPNNWLCKTKQKRYLEDLLGDRCVIEQKQIDIPQKFVSECEDEGDCEFGFHIMRYADRNGILNNCRRSGHVYLRVEYSCYEGERSQQDQDGKGTKTDSHDQERQFSHERSGKRGHKKRKSRRRQPPDDRSCSTTATSQRTTNQPSITTRSLSTNHSGMSHVIPRDRSVVGAASNSDTFNTKKKKKRHPPKREPHDGGNNPPPRPRPRPTTTSLSTKTTTTTSKTTTTQDMTSERKQDNVETTKIPSNQSTDTMPKKVLIGASVAGAVILLILIVAIAIFVSRRNTIKRADRHSSKMALQPNTNRASPGNSERYTTTEMQHQGAAPVSNGTVPSVSNGAYQRGGSTYEDHSYLQLMDETRLTSPEYQQLENTEGTGGLSNSGYEGLTSNQYEELDNYRRQMEMSNRRLPPIPPQ